MKAKRLEEITNLLEIKGNVEVLQLSSMLNVSPQTIRQDLSDLADMNIATRVHGGATLKKETNTVYPAPARKESQLIEKKQIAKAALSLIHDEDIIIIDSGSTTQELAKILDKEVIVITNDPVIVELLLPNEKVTVFCTGGKLRRKFGYTYVGKDAIEMLKRYHAHKCFIGASAFDLQRGLMVFSSEEADVKKTIMEVSDQVIGLIDYSKFNQTAFTTFAEISEIDFLITDSRVPESHKKQLAAIGLNVTIG